MTTDKSPRSKPSNDESNVPEEEELVANDDAAIGRALRVSAAVLIVLGFGALGFFFLKPKPKQAEVKKTVLTAPETVTTAINEPPLVEFEDVTASAGIKFTHRNGAYGDKLLPETMGGGAAFLDFDADNDQDLLFISGNEWPWKASSPNQSLTLTLYKNEGNGRFTDVSVGSGLECHFYGMGAAVGDYNNDGLVDVFVTGVGQTKLFKNAGAGQFQDVTQNAGVSGKNTDWTTGATWLDIDNDGLLDLFVCNYVRWSKEIDLEVGYKLVGVGRAYGPPMNFAGSYPILYRNNGNGTFSDISSKSGVQVNNPSTGVPTGKGMAVVPADLNKDGWMDLVVANDTVQNFVFLNQKDGSFKEVGAISGIAFDSYGNTRGAMGIDAAWFRNDSTLGIAIANFANEMSALYVEQKQPMSYADESIGAGIGPAGRLNLKFGMFFFDYDLDGRQDILTCNGHLEEEINKVQQSQHYKQPAQLFWNSGATSGPSFISTESRHVGTQLFEPIVGRGSAFADIDNDGDLDVLLMQVGGRPKLLLNKQKLNHSWIRLKLTGSKSNRDGIGALVQLKSTSGIQSRIVTPTRSYLSQSESVLTFGLGKSESAASVEIRWPDGSSQSVPDLAANRHHKIQQP